MLLRSSSIRNLPRCLDVMVVAGVYFTRFFFNLIELFFVFFLIDLSYATYWSVFACIFVDIVMIFICKRFVGNAFFLLCNLVHMLRVEYIFLPCYIIVIKVNSVFGGYCTLCFFRYFQFATKFL